MARRSDIKRTIKTALADAALYAHSARNSVNLNNPATFYAQLSGAEAALHRAADLFERLVQKSAHVELDAAPKEPDD